MIAPGGQKGSRESHWDRQVTRKPVHITQSSRKVEVHHPASEAPRAMEVKTFVRREKEKHRVLKAVRNALVI